MVRVRIPLAWVESPLQLVGAAEWADAAQTSIDVAGRLTAQISETADELLARGARFADTDPYLGIPWKLLASHAHWLVGDGFSGQFRLAAAVLRPRRVTFLDDGANALAFADALTGRAPYARPGNRERGLTTRIAPWALAHLQTRAIAGDVDVFTAFTFGAARTAALAGLGIDVTRHTFEWTRRTARRAHEQPSGHTSCLREDRLILGSARPVDGRMPISDYLEWVRAAAAEAPVVYLPHRREPAAQRDAVRAIRGVTMCEANLPAEMLLAGAPRPLEILTLTSSVESTLPLVLAGTGSTVRVGAIGRTPVRSTVL